MNRILVEIHQLLFWFTALSVAMDMDMDMDIDMDMDMVNNILFERSSRIIIQGGLTFDALMLNVMSAFVLGLIPFPKFYTRSMGNCNFLLPYLAENLRKTPQVQFTEV